MVDCTFLQNPKSSYLLFFLFPQKKGDAEEVDSIEAKSGELDGIKSKVESIESKAGPPKKHTPEFGRTAMGMCQNGGDPAKNAC